MKMRCIEAPGNPPMVVEIIDTEDRIHAFLHDWSS
jgi:PII-like signaling protein